MKTIEDFKQKAKERNITKWIINECSFCKYECGFLIRGDRLFYDNGCKCVWYPPSERDWNDLVSHYNMQTSKKYIKEMNKFWGFK